MSRQGKGVRGSVLLGLQFESNLYPRYLIDFSEDNLISLGHSNICLYFYSSIYEMLDFLSS